MSTTRIQSLPPSLLQLSDLLALLLGDCFFLEELPRVGVLNRLQIIDLSATRTKEQPKDMKNLINLRQLNLSSTGLTKIQVEGEVEEGQATFEEIGCLKRQTASTAPVVPNLKKLELEDLPMLRTVISRPKELCPPLEHIEIIKCYLLRKLPLTVQNANIIKEIRGESHWWSELKWDNHKTKSSLRPYFESVHPEIQVPKCPDNTPVETHEDMRYTKILICKFTELEDKVCLNLFEETETPELEGEVVLDELVGLDEV
ncbi:hypothetical protein FEM48_Zijuj01G0221800 [Ziziphus jujuba var. spinosa]|uniref:Uncharacterized protein n=1 Tax=Ziziphus jujuba var. spinosa TaxID=714518 RepID=A0A978W3U9_ZIZJJ|nr:hypothetical protein FEM48_Zijuj01G0221800 [Ziziphus jujuba var. spinosa]